MKIKKSVSPIHFDVIGDSGQVYLVDIKKMACTCMDWIMQTSRLVDIGYKPSYNCKHVNFVLSLVSSPKTI